MAWELIKTAPRDGTAVLLWAASWEMSWGIQMGSFEGGEWYTGEGSIPDNADDFDPDAEIDPDEECDLETNMGPTHWHRLPATPE